MAELTSFSYRSGCSLLHRIDVRFKLLFLAAISLASLRARPFLLLFATILISFLLLSTRLSLLSLIKELRYFLLFLFFVFITRALFTHGSTMVEWGWMRITREGLHSGMLIGWRLLLIVLLGLLFVSTTRYSEIKAAIIWLLKPFPFIPGKRIAVMIGLMVRFVPVLFDQAQKIQDAQRARGVENRKNPLYRFKKLIIPLVFRTFETADKLTTAMEARCYSENRTESPLSSGLKDWGFLFAAICIFILMVVD